MTVGVNQYTATERRDMGLEQLALLWRQDRLRQHVSVALSWVCPLAVAAGAAFAGLWLAVGMCLPGALLFFVIGTMGLRSTKRTYRHSQQKIVDLWAPTIALEARLVKSREGYP